MLGTPPWSCHYTEEEYRAFARLEYSLKQMFPQPEPDQSRSAASKLLAARRRCPKKCGPGTPQSGQPRDGENRMRTTTDAAAHCEQPSG